MTPNIASESTWFKKCYYYTGFPEKFILLFSQLSKFKYLTYLKINPYCNKFTAICSIVLTSLLIQNQLLF